MKIDTYKRYDYIEDSKKDEAAKKAKQKAAQEAKEKDYSKRY